MTRAVAVILFGGLLYIGLTASPAQRAAYAQTRPAAATNLVLLFDKHCAHCNTCVRWEYSKRRSGEATLTLLERRQDGFLVRNRWHATYGIQEGPKACLHDYRTPEGLYHTDYINHLRQEDKAFGYTSIVTTYPNQEDRADLLEGSAAEEGARKCLCRGKGSLAVFQGGRCGTPCTDPGAAIAIHGGYFGATAGCMRLLDVGVGAKASRAVHSKSIKELGDIIETVPDKRVPLVIALQVAVGCASDVGQMVSHGCSQALFRILDGPQPKRALVNQLLAEAAGEPLRAATAAVTAAPVETEPFETPVERPLRQLEVRTAFASSEATACGDQGNQRCSARQLGGAELTTTWCEGVAGNGESEWLWFELAGRHRIAQVALNNGDWTRGPGSPRWFERGYVSKLEIAVGDRVTVCEHPNNDPAELQCDLEGFVGSQVRLRLKKVVAGEKNEHTCISRVRFLSDE